MELVEIKVQKISCPDTGWLESRERSRAGEQVNAEDLTRFSRLGLEHTNA